MPTHQPNHRGGDLVEDVFRDEGSEAVRRAVASESLSNTARCGETSTWKRTRPREKASMAKDGSAARAPRSRARATSGAVYIAFKV